jgi:hypothetical protein
MRDVLKKKLEELGIEAQSLVEEREKIFRMVQEIEIRLHQISGAISEIDKLLQSEEKKGETSKTD